MGQAAQAAGVLSCMDVGRRHQGSRAQRRALRDSVDYHVHVCSEGSLWKQKL